MLIEIIRRQVACDICKKASPEFETIIPEGWSPEFCPEHKKLSESADVYPTSVIVHTPEGPLYCCSKHAQAAKSIYTAMGCHVAFEKAIIPMGCINCVNENDKQRR